MNAFGVDQDGFIISDAALAKIPPAFTGLVDRVRSDCATRFAKSLHSLYLYGSIATGRARVGRSDLDAILVFTEHPGQSIRDEVRSLGTVLSAEYGGTVRGVGLEVGGLADLTNGEEGYGFRCFLKHLCVCIYGTDLRDGLPKFKPTNAVARGLNGDVAHVVAEYRRKLAAADRPERIIELSRSAARKLVRTAFCLVMPGLKSWTTDLRESRDAFLFVHPEKRDEIDLAVALAETGTVDKAAVENLLNSFGPWLINGMEAIPEA